MEGNKLQLADSVVVKPDVRDPDWDIVIGGWQGRIAEVDEEDNLILIDWDSLTLQQMPAETIVQSEEEGLDWTKMFLLLQDVEQTTPRDSEDDVQEAIDVLTSKHKWACLCEEGRRIQAVLDKAEDESEWAAYKAWQKHFQEVLEFPFKAEVLEWQERGPLREGDKVKVTSMDEIVDPQGILASLRHGRSEYVFPFCDLKVLDKSSFNYQPVKDYAIWFANR
ncbi:MAG: calcium-binding protein [Candidatus Electrothrix sp. GW3-4]|uniref:calcium-binding protein n=1 Tax=Candidatus Electrothrix sp. GW3-4 TaxID=3126740 RepID=UPI0030D5E404